MKYILKITLLFLFLCFSFSVKSENIFDDFAKKVKEKLNKLVQKNKENEAKGLSHLNKYVLYLSKEDFLPSPPTPIKGFSTKSKKITDIQITEINNITEHGNFKTEYGKNTDIYFVYIDDYEVKVAQNKGQIARDFESLSKAIQKADNGNKNPDNFLMERKNVFDQYTNIPTTNNYFVQVGGSFLVQFADNVRERWWFSHVAAKGKDKKEQGLSTEEAIYTLSNKARVNSSTDLFTSVKNTFRIFVNACDYLMKGERDLTVTVTAASQIKERCKDRCGNMTDKQFYELIQAYELKMAEKQIPSNSLIRKAITENPCILCDLVPFDNRPITEQSQWVKDFRYAFGTIWISGAVASSVVVSAPIIVEVGIMAAPLADACVTALGTTFVRGRAVSILSRVFLRQALTNAAKDYIKDQLENLAEELILQTCEHFFCAEEGETFSLDIESQSVDGFLNLDFLLKPDEILKNIIEEKFTSIIRVRDEFSVFASELAGLMLDDVLNSFQQVAEDKIEEYKTELQNNIYNKAEQKLEAKKQEILNKIQAKFSKKANDNLRILLLTKILKRLKNTQNVNKKSKITKRIKKALNKLEYSCCDYESVVEKALTNAGYDIVAKNAIKQELCAGTDQNKDIAEGIQTKKITAKGTTISGITFNNSDNYFDVIVHGKGNTFDVFLEKNGTITKIGINAIQLANELKNIPTNKPLRLLSCSNLASAKDLSKALEREIIATNGKVKLYHDGTIISDTGKWYKLKSCDKEKDIPQNLSDSWKPKTNTDKNKYVVMGEGIPKIYIGTNPPNNSGGYITMYGHTFIGFSYDGRQENTKWYEIRATGDLYNQNGERIGKKVKMKNMSPETVFNKYIFEQNGEIIYKSVTQTQYDDAIKMLDILRFRESEYNPIYNNCATHCSEILNPIGFTLVHPVIAIPLDYHKELIEKYGFIETNKK